MSLLHDRAKLRWALPAGVLAVALVSAGGGQLLRANAAPSLPDRGAAQLLVDLQNAHPDGFSGTVVQKADLGLPALPNIGGQGSSDLSSLVSGAHTLRVWYAGEDKVRLALLGTLGESDVIRNGKDLWTWSSNGNTASHRTLRVSPGRDGATNELTGELPQTPQEAADRALAAISPTTKVVTDGTATVAGRSAYELVLSPRDTASKVGQIRLAVDADRHIPLRVRVFAKNATAPAFEVGFTQLSFAKPGAEQFRFSPPPGAKVTEEGKATADRKQLDRRLKGELPSGKARPPAAEPGRPVVIGKGWTSVLVTKADLTAMPTDLPRGDRQRYAEPGPSGLLDSVLGKLPQVKGAWGTGRLLESKLFSVLVTDDGRVLAGAVSPDRLYAAASDPAASLKALSAPAAKAPARAPR